MYTSYFKCTHVLQVSGMFRSVFVLFLRRARRPEPALGNPMNKHQLASGASQ